MKQPKTGRPSFTLIELLVVIAIIGILTTLITASVMSVLRKAEDVQTRQDISSLSNSLALFKQRFGVYPPPRIYLSNSVADYSSPNPLLPPLVFRQESLKIINQIWPGLGRGNPAWTGIDWSGTPMGMGMPLGGKVLEGHQCLVFFLRGINGTGFSTNPANPTLIGGNRIGGGAWFDFPANRLVGDPLFPSLQDSYGRQPYLYFSAGSRTNGYYYTWNPISMSWVTDCSRDYPGVGPYVKAYPPLVPPLVNPLPPQFINPDSFQIISAGRDGGFGPGLVIPNGASLGPNGIDNMANFSDGLLGAY